MSRSVPIQSDGLGMAQRARQQLAVLARRQRQTTICRWKSSGALATIALVSDAEVMPELGSVPLGQRHSRGSDGRGRRCRSREEARDGFNLL